MPIRSLKKKYVIMCVGHTHSGKTTFAKKLLKTVQDAVLIDNDEIASFIKEKYPTVVLSDYNKGKKTLKDSNLKFLLWKDVFGFSLQTGCNVILSNGNLGKDIREHVSRSSKKAGYKLITVYFNLPEDVLFKRIQHTKKTTKAFIHTKDWLSVLKNQKGYAQLPPSKKNTGYFEMRNDTDPQAVLKELGMLLSK